MTRTMTAAAALACLLAGRPASPDPSAAAPSLDGKGALQRLKALAGEWQGHMTTEDGPPMIVRYEVGSGGTIVKETLFPGSDHEMLSVYHLVGGELVMTHYCAMGNQPKMKLNRAASNAGELVFDFDGGTNFDPAKDTHIHSGRISLADPNRVVAEWAHFTGGKQTGSAKMWVSRKK
jgi:hypothetical protein